MVVYRLIVLIGIIWMAAPIRAADWSIYTKIDAFAYSEPVSIDAFTQDFDDTLTSGDDAFTHDQIEFGLKWRNWRLAAVTRFDYITEFTNDTALVHFWEKHDIPIDEERQYDLALRVDKVVADGFKLGYTHKFGNNVSIDAAFSYYPCPRDLLSGKVTGFGDPSVDQQTRDTAQTIIDSLTIRNPDLSPLYGVVADIVTTVTVDYHYGEPEFGEPEFRQPHIIGDPNPTVSGVDFSEPEGKGFSLDLALDWQVNEKLHLSLSVQDIYNEFQWDDAPFTVTTFVLNPFLVEAIAMAQEFALGEVVAPNDLVDEHVQVFIGNASHDQHLPWRADLAVGYKLDPEFELFGYRPAQLTLIGGYYRASRVDFPRIGLGIGNRVKVEFDITSKALAATYMGRYLYARLISDSFSTKDAKIFGLEIGLNYAF
jgi:hypothetical protein